MAVIASLVLAPGRLHAETSLELQPVTDGVYALIGDLGNRSAANLGNNATFGFAVTDAGVVLIDPGGSYRGAAEIHRLIKSVTQQPVVTVINTGGQDHRWLGNGYFKKLGAEIIASNAAVADQKARLQDQLIRLASLAGEDTLAGTEAVYADRSFTAELDLEVGGTRFELRHRGHAHTPGDIFVWLPQSRVMFSGDIVYTERMLAVGAQSSSKGWVEAFRAMAGYAPAHLVPGHGGVTDLARARRDTLDYLVYLRDAVAAFIDEGGDLAEIGGIDQSEFGYLLNFDLLAGRNAQQVFTEIEWE